MSELNRRDFLKQVGALSFGGALNKLRKVLPIPADQGSDSLVLAGLVDGATRPGEDGRNYYHTSLHISLNNAEGKYQSGINLLHDGSTLHLSEGGGKFVKLKGEKLVNGDGSLYGIQFLDEQSNNPVRLKIPTTAMTAKLIADGQPGTMTYIPERGFGADLATNINIGYNYLPVPIYIKEDKLDGSGKVLFRRILNEPEADPNSQAGLVYPPEFLKNYTELEYSNMELAGKTYNTLTGVDKGGTRQTIALEFVLTPEWSAEKRFWLQYYQPGGENGKLILMISPKINGYMDVSGTTLDESNKFVTEYLQKSQDLDGDTRFGNVLENNGKVIAIAASVDDMPWNLENASTYGPTQVDLDNGEVTLKTLKSKIFGEWMYAFSAWFRNNSNDLTSMAFYDNKFLVENGYHALKISMINSGKNPDIITKLLESYKNYGVSIDSIYKKYISLRQNHTK